MRRLGKDELLRKMALRKMMLVILLNEGMEAELSHNFCEYATSLDTDSAGVKVMSPRPRSRSSRATTRRGAA